LFILTRPASPPSFCISPSLGIMIVSSWMMIEAVMYGPTPSIATEKFLSPPPAKILNNPNNWLLFRTEDSPERFINGIGICARIRVTKSRARTMSILFRRSLAFQICEIRDIFLLLYFWYLTAGFSYFFFSGFGD
jgi:hypothetical protein